jgi:hypothetical protein
MIKDEALTQVFRGGELAVQAIAQYVSADNVGLVVRGGDVCLLNLTRPALRSVAPTPIRWLVGGPSAPPWGEESIVRSGLTPAN